MHGAHKKGFTLLEVILVFAAFAILVGIVILAFNPQKQISDSKNSQRRTDITTILNAVYQFSLDHQGKLPETIGTTTAEICNSSVATTSCAGLVNLTDALTSVEQYVTGIPIDPRASTTNGTGYFIFKAANEHVTVSAPLAEQGEIISVTR